ncbi:MAG TPA: GNAT family N-acetyltransferase [Pseudolabrys sp.]|nr:GNAT family N-acetyltransferase [Pseudolabrys sp.]
MRNAVVNAESSVRPLRPSDLDRVIAIDSSHVGESRRRFFEKRLANARQHPEDFVHIGVVRSNALVGFAFARILRGEFGRDRAVATVDAVGVDYDSQARGIGRVLMNALTEMMRKKGVHALQSQADWTNHGLLRFFDVSGFGLAPRLVLERSVLTPLVELVEDE